jgi:hypothetical protein
MNFFARDPLEITPLDLLRVVLNCRGLPYGSVVMALNTARQSLETAKHFKCEEKEALYKTMIEELEVVLASKPKPMRTEESSLE